MKSTRTSSMTLATAPRKFDAKTGSPFILPVWSGYEAVDATHKLRIPFDIPDNLGVIQKVTVSFRGLPFRSGTQTTSGASSSSTTASGGSSSPTSDASLDIDLFIPILKESGLSGPFVNVDWDAGGNTLALV